LFSNTKISDQKVNQAGLGLGLTVSHSICQFMGGNLSLISSVEGVGSKFSIMIPVLQRVDLIDEESSQYTESSATSFDENDDEDSSLVSERMESEEDAE
jgi:hypothetical protein